MKKCTKCQKEKPLNEFYKDCSKKDGHRSACKLCIRKHTPELRYCLWYKCRKEFLSKAKNQRFCRRAHKECYYSHINFCQGKNMIATRKYYRKNKAELCRKGRQYSYADGNECTSCGTTITNNAKRCAKCHLVLITGLAAKQWKMFQ